jgi:hypothetical protein
VQLPTVSPTRDSPDAPRKCVEPTAQETLGAAITRPREIITVDSIIKAVASYYGLKPSDIKSERRHKSVATPRAVAMYISRHNTKDSYPDLARAFGGKQSQLGVRYLLPPATGIKVLGFVRDPRRPLAGRTRGVPGQPAGAGGGQVRTRETSCVGSTNMRAMSSQTRVTAM